MQIWNISLDYHTFFVWKSIVSVRVKSISHKLTDLWPCRLCRGWSLPQPGQSKSEPPQSVCLERRCTASSWGRAPRRDRWGWERRHKQVRTGVKRSGLEDTSQNRQHQLLHFETFLLGHKTLCSSRSKTAEIAKKYTNKIWLVALCVGTKCPEVSWKSDSRFSEINSCI